MRCHAALMKWISRAILTVMLLAAAALLAFGPRPNHQVPPGRTIVTYWEKWTGPDAEAMRSIVNDFNATVGEKKNIYIQYISLANVQHKTLAAIAGGVPPDIAGLWTSQLVQYALGGVAIPLNDLAREHGIDAGDYKKIFWDMCTYRGRLWAVPTTPAVVALHYNKRFFYEAADKLEALGFDPTLPPQSIAEFDQYAQALDMRGPDGRLSRAGYFTMDSGWYIAVTGTWFGGGNWDAQRQRYTVATTQNQAAFEWIAGYSRRMGADVFQDFRSGLGGFASPTNPFISGAVAMVQQGPWMGNYIKAYGPDMSQAMVPFVLEPFLPRVVRLFNYDWAVAAFPSAVPGVKDVGYCESDTLMIPRGAPHPREAFEFIVYTQRSEVMEKLCKLTWKNSPLKKTSDDFVYTHPNPYVDVFDRIAASPTSKAIDQTPIYNWGLTQIDLAAQNTYLLKKSPHQALADAQAALDARLERYEEQDRKRQSDKVAR
ncbi:MAG: extracellular solute-binding protein [Tepidisphaeraceae bacterium]